jgi:hypothetical protein
MVQSFGKPKRIPGLFHVAMGDLCERMHARIRPTRCGYRVIALL